MLERIVYIFHPFDSSLSSKDFSCLPNLFSEIFAPQMETSSSVLLLSEHWFSFLFSYVWSVYMHICVACFGVCARVCRGHEPAWGVVHLGLLRHPLTATWNSPVRPWSGSAMVSNLLSQHGPCKHLWERTRKGSWPFRVGDLPRLWPEKLNQLLASLSHPVKEELPPAVSLLLRDLPSTIFGKRIDFGVFFCSPTLQYRCKCFHIGIHLWGRLESTLLGYGHSGLSENELSLISCGGRKRKERLSDVLSGSKSSLIPNCYL